MGYKHMCLNPQMVRSSSSFFFLLRPRSPHLASTDRLGYHFVGCFWAGMYLVIPSYCGMRSKHRSFVKYGMVAGLVGMCAALSAVIVDGSAYALYSSLEACGLSPALNHSGVHPETYNYTDIIVSGNQNFSLAAQYCAFYFSDYDCACTKDMMTRSSGPAPECYVFSGGSGDSLKTNCDYVLEDYPHLLDASFGVSIVCLMIVTIFTVLTFVSLNFPTVFEPEYYKKRAELDQMSQREYEKLKKMIMKEEELKKDKISKKRTSAKNDDIDFDGDSDNDDDDTDILKSTSRRGFYEDTGSNGDDQSVNSGDGNE